MSIDNDILHPYGGMEMNSLEHVLHIDYEDVNRNNEINVICHSPYFDSEMLKPNCQKMQTNFAFLVPILNVSHQSLENLKFFINELKKCSFEFSAICLQETWLHERDDYSHVQIEGYRYTCTSQGKTCSTVASRATRVWLGCVLM